MDTPEEIYASECPAAPAPRRRTQRTPAASRPNARAAKQQRDFADDFAAHPPSFDEAEESYSSRRSGGLRVRLRGELFRIPRTLWGRILSGVFLLALLGCVAATVLIARTFFLHDDRFRLQSASSIEITGNTHLTREQLLDIFGQDLERNIFAISLADRRHELEQLPWVQRATVMRLLPDHLRIAITERTPVAFVRQGTQIGLVDASGVLLDMSAETAGDPHYSFPVVTGLSATDPLSTRAARMKLYTRFTTDLDSAGEKISAKLSEIDLSDPEDIKALIPEGTSDLLVHFGDTDFLARYKRFQQHLADWHTQYPRLASVDMRYERQVVLEMQPGSNASAAATPNPATPATGNAAKKPVAKSTAKATAKPPKKGPATAAKSNSTGHAGASPSHTVATANPATKKTSTPAKAGAQRAAQQQAAQQ
jgi:cell division protein FtsQ